MDTIRTNPLPSRREDVEKRMTVYSHGGEDTQHPYSKRTAGAARGLVWLGLLMDKNLPIRYKSKEHYHSIATTMETFSHSFSLLAIATTLAIVFLSLFYIIIKAFIDRSSSFSKNPKKKRYHPVAGTIINHLLNFNRVHDYMTELAHKHKTYRMLSPFRSEIYTSDPANIKYILKTNYSNYGKGLQSYTLLNDLLGDGIFTADGDKWRHQRKALSYEFSAKTLRDFSSVTFRTNAVKLAQLISRNATSNMSMDIQELFMKSTLDSIVKVALGVDLDSMCGSSEEGRYFANAFDESSTMTVQRHADIFWTIKRFLNIGSEATLKKNIRVIDDFVYKHIRGRMQQISDSSNDSSADLLTGFLNSSITDPKYLRDMVLNIVMAGKDTTAASLSWFLYMLCKHPNIQEKVAQEVREATKVKDSINFEEFAATVTDAALEQMQYLHAALTETLRIYPPVPVDGKICFSDDTLPDGFSVTKGDMVAYQPYAMGRMKFIWGDDAEEFRPERWLGDDGIFRSESPFKFTAFQAGPRICLGKEFAHRQMKIFSAILLGCFRFEMSDHEKTVKYKTMINLHIDGGLHLRAFHRLVGCKSR